LDVIPTAWIGKGQLLYVLFLWLMVIGNLMRAIPGYTNGRMTNQSSSPESVSPSLRGSMLRWADTVDRAAACMGL
jgi:hypothetical protein